MDSKEPVKEFTKATEVLPFTKYGLTSFGEFKEVESEIQRLEYLKKVGLTDDEIKLYNDHKAGVLDAQNKIENNILQEKLNNVLKKVSNYKKTEDKCCNDVQPSTSTTVDKLVETLKRPATTTYPAGHPMNDIKRLEDDLFPHKDKLLPINKRRKVLRHLERKEAQLESQKKELIPCEKHEGKPKNGNSLWDMQTAKSSANKPIASSSVIGPKKPSMYTIKDKKILRLEPAVEDEDHYQAVDIVVPVNNAELLNDLRKIERFKDYEPGIPSKVLYLKNLDNSVTQQQLSILFNQFVMDNQGPIDVRLMTGRMRGQAFIGFQNDHVAIQALDEINGTVLCGKPIIAEFGRNSNRIQIDDDR